MDRLYVRLGFLTSFAASSLAFSTLLSCARLPQNSNIKSVEIEQTPVKNQYSIGFCWAYATIGLVESNYKMKTGNTINLSEEALGYARMREEMYQLAMAYKKGRISMDQALDATQGDGLEGWFVRTDDGDRNRDAMELIDDYGVVPESAWSVKFQNPESVNQLKASLLSPFRNLLAKNETITRDALDKVLTAPGAFPSMPPKLVTFDNVTMTPNDLARKILRFSSADYVSLQASDASTSLEMIQIMKRAMAAGHSVPLSFAVSFSNLQNGFFRAPNYASSNLDADPNLASSIINASGGHAVLATDFVNIGGREGAIEADALQSEVAKDAEQLSYVKFKNSWGAQASTNERGINVSSSKDGYYRMDLGYIKAVAAMGHFGIVVPRSFVE